MIFVKSQIVVSKKGFTYDKHKEKKKLSVFVNEQA